MLEKMLHKAGNMFQNGVQMGAKIEKISIKMEVQKYMIFCPTRGLRTVAPGSAPRDLGGPF